MGGVETFREIRRRFRPELPIILCSGFDEQNSTRSFGDQGLAGFLQKPYEFQALLTQVGRAIPKKNVLVLSGQSNGNQADKTVDLHNRVPYPIGVRAGPTKG